MKESVQPSAFSFQLFEEEKKMYTRVVLSFILSFLALGGLMRGTPDGSLQPYAYASQVTDPALIYQFLWGFSPVDGQGRPYFLDTFNNGLGGWASVITGAAKQATLFSNTPSGLIYSPPNAMLLSPGVILNDITQVNHTIFLGQNPRLGFEAGLVIHNTMPDHYFRLTYERDASHDLQATLCFLHSAPKWQILTNSGAVDIFQMGLPIAGTTLLQQVKIVADWSTGKYVRALIGDNLIDLSAYSMPVASSAYPGYVNIVIQAISYGAGTGDAYIGYVIGSKDEP